MRSWFVPAVLCLGLSGLGEMLPLVAKPFEIPPQKILIALPSMTSVRKTAEDTYTVSAAVGFAAEYSLFLRPDLGLIGQFGLNLAEGNQGAIYLGGSGGIAYYFKGGANLEYQDANIKTMAKAGLNAFTLLGFSSKQFDYTSIPDKAADDPSVAQGEDPKASKKGNVMGILFGLGVEYPIKFDLYGGARYQIFQSFSATDQPDVTINELWLSLGFVF